MNHVTHLCVPEANQLLSPLPGLGLCHQGGFAAIPVSTPSLAAFYSQPGNKISESNLTHHVFLADVSHRCLCPVSQQDREAFKKQGLPLGQSHLQPRLCHGDVFKCQPPGNSE